MPDTRITIDRDHRDGLYELVRNHLGAIGDFWLVFEQQRDFATAERLGLEFAADFRLLEDIGRADHDPRERYVLTMPAYELTSLLLRLQGEAGVQELADELGLAHQNVSHHLAVLHRAGILERRRERTTTLYAISDWSSWWVIEQISRWVREGGDERVPRATDASAGA